MAKPKHGLTDMEDLAILLSDAGHEITTLRRRNEILSAKVEMIELMRDMLYAQYRRSGEVYTKDIVPELHKAAEDIASRIRHEESMKAT